MSLKSVLFTKASAKRFGTTWARRRRLGNRLLRRDRPDSWRRHSEKTKRLVRTKPGNITRRLTLAWMRVAGIQQNLGAWDSTKTAHQLDLVQRHLARLQTDMLWLIYYAGKDASRELRAIDARRGAGEHNRERVIKKAKSLLRAGYHNRDLVRVISEASGLSQRYVRDILIAAKILKPRRKPDEVHNL